MIYRDAGHCIARVFSIETNDGTAKAGWQMRYQSGFPETRGEGSGLSAEERLTQDAMTRGMLHRELTALQWNVLVAKYSINDLEVAEAVRWLIPRVETKAHRLFVTKAVTAWAVPQRAKAAGPGKQVKFTDIDESEPEWRKQAERVNRERVLRSIKAEQQLSASRMVLPDAFYVLHNWDAEGTPERTLRHWRQQINRTLGREVEGAFVRTEAVLSNYGLLTDKAA